jgi:hypothetical protein
VQILLGQVDDFLPQPQRARIAALEQDDTLPGAAGKGRIGVELGPRRLVEGVRVGLQEPGVR